MELRCLRLVCSMLVELGVCLFVMFVIVVLEVVLVEVWKVEAWSAILVSLLSVHTRSNV